LIEAATQLKGQYIQDVICATAI